MIKRFHGLYVGQIELEYIGLDGTPAYERRYSATPIGSQLRRCGRSAGSTVKAIRTASFPFTKSGSRTSFRPASARPA